MRESSVDPILEAMIGLSHCPAGARIILAGASAPGRIDGWRRRGYRRVVTTATCRLPDGRCGAACIEWRRGSIRALEATLDWLVHFLSADGVVVIWVDAALSTAAARRELRAALERSGLAVEAGTRCGSGFAVSARRHAAGAYSAAVRRLHHARRVTAAASRRAITTSSSCGSAAVPTRVATSSTSSLSSGSPASMPRNG